MNPADDIDVDEAYIFVMIHQMPMIFEMLKLSKPAHYEFS